MLNFSYKLTTSLLIIMSISACSGGGTDTTDISSSEQYEAVPSSPISVIDDNDSDGVADEYDVDMDGDGLIEISTIQALSAIRNYQDHSVIPKSNKSISSEATTMGCPETGCLGFELTQDLYFPEISLRSTGIFWNNGLGWDPIGDEQNPFTGIFNGNGYSIHNLYINRPEEDHVGIFGYIATLACPPPFSRETVPC